MAAREVAHLRFPIGVVGCEFVQEDDRRSRARLLEMQANMILGDGVGHLRFLLVLARSPSPKFAVNALGRNAAGLFLFGHQMSAE